MPNCPVCDLDRKLWPLVYGCARCGYTNQRALRGTCSICKAEGYVYSDGESHRVCATCLKGFKYPVAAIINSRGKEVDMAKRTVQLKIKNLKGGAEVYIKAPFLEKLFQQLSSQHYGTERLQPVYANEGELLYQYYLLPNLPEDCPRSLGGGPNPLESFGFLRAKGLSKGLTLYLTRPIPIKVANAFKEAVTTTVDYLHAAYAEQFVLYHTIEYDRKVDSGVENI